MTTKTRAELSVRAAELAAEYRGLHRGLDTPPQAASATFVTTAIDVAIILEEYVKTADMLEADERVIRDYTERLLERANEEPPSGWLRPGEDGYENTPDGARAARDAAITERDEARAQLAAAEERGRLQLTPALTTALELIAANRLMLGYHNGTRQVAQVEQACELALGRQPTHDSPPRCICHACGRSDCLNERECPVCNRRQP